jgi:hypothetical protein
MEWLIEYLIIWHTSMSGYTELKSRKPTYQLRSHDHGNYLPEPRRLEATGETLEGKLARCE